MVPKYQALGDAPQYQSESAYSVAATGKQKLLIESEKTTKI